LKAQKAISAAILLAVLVFPFGRQASTQQFTVKFATVAPEGSTWMNLMREYDAAVRDESRGRLRFKIYGGSSQGEDNVVLRKIRLGQLHSAGLTGVGLGEIAPKVRILDSPFLFRNYEEVDYLYEKLDKEFREAFEENDYVLLGWAEVGFVYVFTNSPVRTIDDMSGVRMWMWEGDPVAEATFKALNVNPIPLSIIDVLTSLQTGLIDGAYTSPLAAIALQWFTRVKYMMGVSIADASGAVVVSKKTFDSLPQDLQAILLRNGRKYMRMLTEKSREENASSIKTLERNGIQVIDISSPRTLKEYVDAGEKARRTLVGKLYDQAFLDRVEKILSEYRAHHNSSK
jgi:TRAP-type C4-dicarboxylate transport system substrate-binding protein